MNKNYKIKYNFMGDFMNIGLSLSGGGVKGIAHAGVLKAIEEENIKINYISGTSSGSIIAALYAIGYTADEIFEIFKSNGKRIKYFDYKNIFKLIFGILIKRKIIIDGLSEGKEIEKLIKEKCEEKNIININNTKIPLLIPAVNVSNGEVYFFSSKLTRSNFSDNIQYVNNVNIYSAVRASCGYPGVFSPYEINNERFIDGGVRENIPWKGLKEIGAEKTISVIFEKQIKEKSELNIIDVVESALNIMGHELSNYELIGVDKIIKIKTKNVGLLEVDKMDELYKQGYIQGKKQIKQLNLKRFLRKRRTDFKYKKIIY